MADDNKDFQTGMLLANMADQQKATPAQPPALIEKPDPAAANDALAPIKNVKNEMEMQIVAQMAAGTVGTLDLTEKQSEILYADVDPDDVEIRPDGLVYLPWMRYATRLRKAFGLKWALLPKGDPISSKNNEGKPCLYWGFYLFINGAFAGYAIGEHVEERSGSTMSYSDASEAAKSNALMRLCKGLGMTLEMWDPSWVRKWQEKYAEQIPAVYADSGKPILDPKTNRQKKLWRKKKPPEQTAEEKRKHYLAACHAIKDEIPEASYNACLAPYKVTSCADVPEEKWNEFYLSLNATRQKLRVEKAEQEKKSADQNDNIPPQVPEGVNPLTGEVKPPEEQQREDAAAKKRQRRLIDE